MKTKTILAALWLAAYGWLLHGFAIVVNPPHKSYACDSGDCNPIIFGTLLFPFLLFLIFKPAERSWPRHIWCSILLTFVVICGYIGIAYLQSRFS